jgi:eukaryotic-like serine/threonine-protein kinase
MTSTDKPAQAVQPGDVLADKYRVERVLGQGGMGVVVLAEHIELRERVAIKFLLDSPGENAELAERFIREARAAVRIKSEHVVRVIDVGRLPTGAPYMVMEYLEGEDLSQRLLAGRVPIEDAVDYVIQCCEAMHVAHRSGIVHRDLKPANLFLTQRPDGSALVKVLDFGISKVKSTDAAQLSLTHTQTMMGSPLYMSPEQMRSSKDVSPAADIWSLGVILHELISGDVPFTGATFPEVLVQVMSEPPPKLRLLRPEVPAELEAVVLRCLEKHPADRYSSVATLAVALTPFASARTLGLQSRMRNNVSRPAPAVPVAPVRLIQSTQVVVDVPVIAMPEAVAPTAPAPAPDAASRLGAPVAASLAREHAKTNTAWAEQSSDSAPRGSGSRRLWLAAAGALGAVGLAAALLLRSTGAEPAVAPAGVPAAGGHAPSVNDSSVKPAPRVAPLVEPTAAAVSPSPEPVPASPPPPAPTSPLVEPTAPAITTQDPGSAEAAAEHTSAAAPTATTPEPVSPPAPARAGVRRPLTKTTTQARARAAAATAAQGAASAHAPRERAPAPAAKPASPPVKSKPLSIEFK